MYDKKVDTQEYLSIVIDKLKLRNYHVKEGVKYKNHTFEYVARQTKFVMGRFGLLTTFFVFSKLETSDIHTLKDFSTKAFNHARKTRGIFPPRGFGYGFLCFPVAIVDSVNTETTEYIRGKEPQKHWAAFEKLVVFSLDSKTLYYCEETFSWGYLYYDWDRKIIMEILSP
ncbi:MAG: hypothetical protein A2Y89_02090 [Chloroflexi bacterium RBG_13_51_18]|nr:MAG: hypothetical protein A2Y89_02090 [Chloroflexi bacterium RBG_13_51_18]